MTNRKVIPLYENSKDASGYVELLDYLGDDGLTCVNAARVSFDKKSETFEKKDSKLLNYLIKEKHTSVLEHNVLTFSFKVPLFVARQHMRHRTWSFNEISRRYTSSNIEFYVPENFRQQHKSNRQASIQSSEFDPIVRTVAGATQTYSHTASSELAQHCNSSFALFNKLIDAGVAREQARMVLPQNLYTQYWGTVNLNNFFKFLSLRDHPGSQYEIQLVAKACKSLAKEIWPNLIETYEKQKG